MVKKLTRQELSYWEGEIRTSIHAANDKDDDPKNNIDLQEELAAFRIIMAAARKGMKG